MKEVLPHRVVMVNIPIQIPGRVVKNDLVKAIEFLSGSLILHFNIGSYRLYLSVKGSRADRYFVPQEHLGSVLTFKVPLIPSLEYIARIVYNDLSVQLFELTDEFIKEHHLEHLILPSLNFLYLATMCTMYR